MAKRAQQSIIDFGLGPVNWLSTHNQACSESLPVIHFSPANGIPVASYQSFFDQFSEIANFTGMNCRGAWQHAATPPTKFNYQNHADDLIYAIQSQHQKPVIGMGHSLGGAVTLLAATKQPELFSKLVIIEPASLPIKFLHYIYPLLPLWVVHRFAPFIKRTHQRRTIWPSREAFIDHYKDHPTYRLFTERAMRDYADSGLVKCEDGQFELLFKPEWESHNFRHVFYLWNALHKTAHPTLLLRAEHSGLYSQAQFDQRNKTLQKNITAQMIPNSSHLVTHEKPAIVSQQILAWLETATSLK